MTRSSPSTARFEDVTETTGTVLTLEAARMMYTRYALAADHARGVRVLELGCGSGLGFGLISARARSLVGGDYSMPLLRHARAYYGDRTPLVRLSADRLPFRSSSVDLVLFFEATYYVKNMEEAFDEIGRVLTPEGTVLFANANPERPDFITSPYCSHYHSADGFRSALERRGFRVRTQGGFAIDAAQPGYTAKLGGAIIGAARRLLRRLGLVPRTLRGRAKLKRLLYRHLVNLPPELAPDFAEVEPLTPVPPGPVRGFKVIYVHAQRPGLTTLVPAPAGR